MLPAVVRPYNIYFYTHIISTHINIYCVHIVQHSLTYMYILVSVGSYYSLCFMQLSPFAFHVLQGKYVWLHFVNTGDSDQPWHLHKTEKKGKCVHMPNLNPTWLFLSVFSHIVMGHSCFLWYIQGIFRSYMYFKRSNVNYKSAYHIISFCRVFTCMLLLLWKN